jgi:hypothetical protein
MTQEPTSGTGPDARGPDATPTEVHANPATEPPTPAYERAPAGPGAPAETVARESGTFGAEQPIANRSTGLRWAIAIGGVAIVVAATAIILTLAGGRPSPSVAVGYMPPDTVSYGEYRLDLPGDQQAKLAAFLSKFPGFDDQSIAQTKLYEVFDRIVLAASENKQRFTTDIEPWFGGQIAMGSSPPTAGGSSSGATIGGGTSLFVVTVKDQAKATAWLTSTFADSLSESQHNGATVYVVGPANFDTGLSVIVTDKVMLAGTDAAVRAAFDSKGEGKLADDAEFKAAFATVSRDYVSFSYTEFRALLQSVVNMGAAGAGLESTTIDDELLTLVPAWQASSFRFENDSLVGDAAYPSIDIGFDAKNKKSSLIGHAPPGTIAYAESHDIGPALKAILDRFRNMPELREGFGRVDSAVGVVGGFDGLFGWWGDVAVAISKDADGAIGGGLLIQPTDAAAAKRTFDTLRSFVVLAGSGSGIELRDVEHAGATITVVDLTAIAESSGELPPGVKAEIAYTVTDDIVVIGYGEAFVASVLDAGLGPSLADGARFPDLAKRAGEENIGLSFVDVAAIRDLVEPLAKDAAPSDTWAFYEREIRPYLLPFDAFVSGARVDGDLDRLTQVVTVK